MNSQEIKPADDSSESADAPNASSSAAAPAAVTETRWSAEQILKGGKEALIVHGEMVYRLRLTRSGKLILFK